MSEQATPQVNIAESMRKRVERHAQRFEQDFQARNPAIPNDVFDFSRSGLPSDFDYHPVEVPNPDSPLYSHQIGILQNYLMSGFEFLTDDLVSIDGRDGKPVLPHFVPIDGKVTVAGCYILYADRDWYRAKREKNVAERNAILEKQSTSNVQELEKNHGRNVRRVESERRDVQLEQLLAEEGESDER